MNLIGKLILAKKEIKETKIRKEGKNKFSNYDYFTPTQIELLVQQACFNNKILTKFDLIRNELGVTGKLTIYDEESANVLTYEMATAIPEIKATNIAQQLGGCVTYTERYLKTSAFGITDNNLDFDNNHGSQKENEKQLKINDYQKKQLLELINNPLFPKEKKPKAITFIDNDNSDYELANKAIETYKLFIVQNSTEENRMLNFIKNVKSIAEIDENFYGVDFSENIKKEIEKRKSELKS